MVILPMRIPRSPDLSETVQRRRTHLPGLPSVSIRGYVKSFPSRYDGRPDWCQARRTGQRPDPPAVSSDPWFTIPAAVYRPVGDARRLRAPQRLFAGLHAWRRFEDRQQRLYSSPPLDARRVVVRSVGRLVGDVGCSPATRGATRPNARQRRGQGWELPPPDCCTSEATVPCEPNAHASSPTRILQRNQTPPEHETAHDREKPAKISQIGLNSCISVLRLQIHRVFRTFHGP